MFAVVFTACRTEETEIIDAPPEDVLTSTSLVAKLMQRTSINDGSKDNIIDYANCLKIKLPITVTANGEEIIVSTEEDYNKIEHVFDNSDEDIDSISISYPIDIILQDYSVVTISSSSELNNYSKDCNGENEDDEDIECLDYKYPLTFYIYNSNKDLINTLTVNSDSDLYHFIKDLDPSDFVSINFPITLTLLDGTELTINNLIELEATIKAYDNFCDEDDDFDYNDDDCDHCNIDDLIDFLTGCNDWTVDKLERYGNDYDDAYSGYTFNFIENGTVTAKYYSNVYNGTWEASGSGNNITIIINIPNLPYCNNDWILHEISKYSDSKIDLRVGDNDRMRYKNDCN